MAVKRPIISYVSINSSVGTTSIGNYISDFSYTEEPGFGRSHCEFTLDPSATLIPQIGDAVEIQVKYSSDPAPNNITTGTHKVNDVIYDHVRKVYNIGMSAFDFNGGALNEIGYSYDNASIRAIVDTQATQLSLTVNNLSGISGAIAGFQAQNSSSQTVYRFSGKTRAEILETLAQQYGFLLRVKAGTIFFYDFLDFENASPVLTLSPTSIASDSTAQVRFSTDGVYSAVRVQYMSGGSPITSDLNIEYANVTNRILNLQSKGILYNGESAARFAYGAAKDNNKEQQVFTATTEGNWLYVLGAIIQLSGFSQGNHKYFLRRCVHTLRQSDSWRTMIELQRVFNI